VGQEVSADGSPAVFDSAALIAAAPNVIGAAAKGGAGGRCTLQRFRTEAFFNEADAHLKHALREAA